MARHARQGGPLNSSLIAGGSRRWVDMIVNDRTPGEHRNRFRYTHDLVDRQHQWAVRLYQIVATM
jgi:hypothetical protein